MSQNLTTSVSELIVGDRVWVAGGVIRKIEAIDYLGDDYYNLHYEGVGSDRMVPGDLTYNLAELHEGIDY